MYLPSGSDSGEHRARRSDIGYEAFRFLISRSFSSIDRAASVLFPLKSRQFCHRRMAYSITLALVLVHTLFNGHLLYGFVVLSARAEDGTSTPVCIQRLDSERYEKFFNIYDSYVDVIRTNVIPFVIMSICNIIIINRVCRSNALRNATNKTRARTNKARKKFEKDRQLTLMLLGSSIAFLLLTLPTEISDIIRSHSGGKLVTTKTYLLAAILLSLAHLNYAVSRRPRAHTSHSPLVRRSISTFTH